jgi:GNAT superfamily N-acetyltransferase
VIHYVYVKPAFRRHGVARALLDHIEAPVIYTHHTYILRDLHRHVAGSVFNPYLLNSGGNIQ